MLLNIHTNYKSFDNIDIRKIKSILFMQENKKINKIMKHITQLLSTWYTKKIINSKKYKQNYFHNNRSCTSQ